MQSTVSQKTRLNREDKNAAILKNFDAFMQKGKIKMHYQLLYCMCPSIGRWMFQLSKWWTNLIAVAVLLTNFFSHAAYVDFKLLPTFEKSDITCFEKNQILHILAWDSTHFGNFGHE